VFEPGADFRRAARIVEAELVPPGAEEILLRVRLAGVNASDPMAAAGGYGVASLPFDLGLECGGEVVAVGEGVEEFQVGDSAMFFGLGGYAEYRRVPAQQAFRVTRLTPEVVSAFVAGITASVGLTETQAMRSGETVLVTAAGGGVGSYAVQLARLAGNRVVATCGDNDKAARLRDLGCERVIQHRRETSARCCRRNTRRALMWSSRAWADACSMLHSNTWHLSVAWSASGRSPNTPAGWSGRR
jgi:NADPH:quinone reductase-like Zn-dependent oxidoreductase